MKKNIYFLLVFLLIWTLFASCNDNRLNKLQPIKPPTGNSLEDSIKKPLDIPFKDISALFDGSSVVTTELGKQAKNDFISREGTNPSDYTIVTSERTFLALGLYNYLDASGNEVPLPYKLKFMEILKRKDMLLLDIPTQQNGNILETSGAICWRITKNGELLRPNPIRYPELVLRRKKEFHKNSKLYYGNSNEVFNWEEANNNNYKNVGKEIIENLVEYSFVINPEKLGYLCVANPLEKSIKLTQLSLKTNVIPEKYKAYLVFDKIASLVSLNEGIVKNIPLNESATLFVLGKTQKGQSFGFIKKLITTSNLVVKQELAPISSTQINDFLNSID